MRTRIALAVAALLATATFALADELKVYSTIGVQNGLEPLLPQIEKLAGRKLNVTWGTAAALVKRIQAGEQADVYILVHQSYEVLAKDGKAAAGTQSIFASSGMGVAVKAGAPKPDISTPEKFKAALLAAKSVSYSNPAGGGASGVHFGKVMERMGITDAIKAKAKYAAVGVNSATLVASGEAEMAVAQKPEAMAIAGTEYVGDLPGDYNNVTLYTAGVAADTKQPDAAKAVVKFLTAPEAQSFFKKKGIDAAPAAAPAKAS
jgi:molybdate transport system substrate-binding protein